MLTKLGQVLYHLTLYRVISSHNKFYHVEHLGMVNYDS